MRTTIRLDDDLERELRTMAAAQGTTFGKMVNRALRIGLRVQSSGTGSKRRFKEKPARMGPPAIDLTKALGVAGQLEDEFDQLRWENPL